MMGNVRELWGKMHSYVKSHLWAELLGSVGIIFLCVVLILQSFLKNQYFDYLVNETWKTEKAMLSASSVKLDGVLEDSLFVASEIAIDKELKKYADKVLSSSGSQAIREKMNLYSRLNGISYYSSDIVAVTVVTNKGPLLEYGRYWTGSGIKNLWINDNEQLLNDIYQKEIKQLKDSNAPRYYVSATPAFHSAIPNMQMFHIALPLLGKETSFDNINAVVVVSCKLSNIIESSSLEDENYQDNVCVYLTSEDGKIIYHENDEYIGKTEEEYLNGKSLVKIEKKLDHFGWIEHVAIDKKNMQNDVDKLYRRGIWIYLFLLVLCGVLWQLLLRHVLKPINEIRNAMNDIKSGKSNRMIDINGTNELWQLAERYNEMAIALHLKEQEANREFEEKMQSIKLQSAAEQEALESQINAHFLCNTLNAINYNVIESGNDEVSNLLKNLSNILQYTFSRKSKVVTIGQEIDWVSQYLFLQKYRKMDQFDYEINYPEEYGEWPCCKLFLQPFVENSITHGFENKEVGGLIKIDGWEEKGRFVLRIWDNGCGIEPEIKQEIEKSFTGPIGLYLSKKGHGIGIHNVITRMYMFFGTEFHVELESTVGVETCFTFWLPLPKSKEDDQ